VFRAALLLDAWLLTRMGAVPKCLTAALGVLDLLGSGDAGGTLVVGM
jgi:hypothetical protein